MQGANHLNPWRLLVGIAVAAMTFGAGMTWAAHRHGHRPAHAYVPGANASTPFDRDRPAGDGDADADREDQITVDPLTHTYLGG